MFDDVDAVMMVHAKNKTMVSRGALAANRITLKYHGVSSHASSFPEKGISALDALINTYVAINSLRQFFQDGVRIHGIITKGGDSANIVPDYAEANFLVRAPTLPELVKVKQKVLDAARYSAQAVGAGFEYEEGFTYAERNTNMALAGRFKSHLEQIGEHVDDPSPRGEMGSSDIGNVSQVAPAIHPYIKICDEQIVNHSQAFTDAAASEAARAAMIKALPRPWP